MAVEAIRSGKDIPRAMDWDEILYYSGLAGDIVGAPPSVDLLPLLGKFASGLRVVAAANLPTIKIERREIDEEQRQASLAAHNEVINALNHLMEVETGNNNIWHFLSRKDWRKFAQDQARFGVMDSKYLVSDMVVLSWRSKRIELMQIDRHDYRRQLNTQQPL